MNNAIGSILVTGISRNSFKTLWIATINTGLALFCLVRKRMKVIRNVLCLLRKFKAEQIHQAMKTRKCIGVGEGELHSMEVNSQLCSPATLRPGRKLTLREPEGTRKTFNQVVKKHRTRCRDPGNLQPEDQSARQEPMQGHSQANRV